MEGLPKLPAEFLEVNYDVSEPPHHTSPAIDLIRGPLPFGISEIFWAKIVSANCISFGEDVKQVYDLVLDMKDFPHKLVAGDAISICPRNNKEEVESLLERLGVKEHMDVPCQICIKSGSGKKNAVVPNHIPTVSTLREVFESSLDLHAVPKKLFIRALLEYTSDPKDHESLSSLCSRKSVKYTEWISSGRSYLEALLGDHPSCLPPINVVLEHMPRLQPRPYSIAFLSGETNSQIHIAFSVVQFYVDGVKKTGVCSGWLERLTSSLRNVGDNAGTLCDKVAALNLTSDESPAIKIPVFLRISSGFHAPSDISRPLIMIGPGVGVSPFVGFLQQREQQLKDANLVKVNQCWLFFGCRYPNKDMLYCDEIKRHLSNGTLDKYIIAHSRDRSFPKYVQDNIRLHCQDFCQLLLEEDAYVFVCGDAASMARDVLGVIVDCIAKYKGINKTDAQKIVMELQARGHYKEDVWTIQDDVFRMYNKAMADDKKRQVMNAIVPPERRIEVCDMV